MAHAERLKLVNDFFPRKTVENGRKKKNSTCREENMIVALTLASLETFDVQYLITCQMYRKSFSQLLSSIQQI